MKAITFSDLFHFSDHIRENPMEIKYHSNGDSHATLKAVRPCLEAMEIFLHLNNGVDFLIKSHSNQFALVHKLSKKNSGEVNLPKLQFDDFKYKLADKAVLAKLLDEYYELKLVVLLKKLCIFPSPKKKKISIFSNNSNFEKTELFQRLQFDELEMLQLDYIELLAKYRDNQKLLQRFFNIENAICKLLYSMMVQSSKETIKLTHNKHNYSLEFL